MNVLITGASRGLGLEIAAKLLRQGHNVIAINRSSTAELEEIINEYPGQGRIIKFDLSQASDVKKVIFDQSIGLRYPIHAYINNAARAYDDLITNLSLESLEEMFAVNVSSPFILTKYAIRSMLLNRIMGSIVHISSISVHTGYKGLAMYAASKGAVEAFSKNTAREWGAKGIRSNCIVAGFMETEMSSSLSDSQKTRIYNRTALKKPTLKSSVAEMAVFLINEGAASITGQNIHVDSGTI